MPYLEQVSQDTLQNADPNSVDPIVNTYITIATVTAIVLGIALLVGLIISAIHRWKADKATIVMSKDIREIKEILLKER